MKLSRVHCFFEQSGTFKLAFSEFGIPAYDYDIQNNFGETDHVIDLFLEIENAYGGSRSVFDEITKEDLIIAFFPCIYFCSLSQLNIRGDSYGIRSLPPRKRCEIILNLHNKRNEFYAYLRKFCCVVLERGIPTIIENGYHHSYLRESFDSPTIVDFDRTNRGDRFVKPTAYWFYNCSPTHCFTYEKSKSHIVVRQYSRKELSLSSGRTCEFARRSSKSGICSQERSMISPAYARNFIADFILGIPSPNGKFQQGDFFDS